MINELVTKLEQGKQITANDFEPIINHINKIIENLDGRLKNLRKRSEIIKNLEMEEERLLRSHIENLDEINGEFAEDDWEQLYNIKNNYIILIIFQKIKELIKGLLEYLAPKIPAMKKETRVVIFIPARLEGTNISRTLQEYTQQKDLKGGELNPDLYEIVILVNRREDEEADNTMEEIERFKGEHPRFNIHALEIVFPQNMARIGFCRRILTDVILYRAQQRKEKKRPTLFNFRRC